MIIKSQRKQKLTLRKPRKLAARWPGLFQMTNLKTADSNKCLFLLINVIQTQAYKHKDCLFLRDTYNSNWDYYGNYHQHAECC